MTSLDYAPRPITGRFVLIATVSFFAVVIAVNVVMMRLAITTLPGTEVDSAYSASLAYQHDIEAAHQQDLRHWQIDAHVARGTDGTASLAIKARDAAGQALAGLAITGRLERPIDRREDRSFEIDARGGGDYRGVASGVAAGQWDLVIEAERGGARVFLSRNRIKLQ